MSVYQAIIITFLLLLTSRVTSVSYGAYNPYPESAGGARFEKEIGIEYATNTLSAATEFIWQIFNQTENPHERKPGITRVTLHVVPWKGEVSTKKNQIYLSSIYIYNYKGDVKREFTRVIYHEMTHIWQWTGNDQAPKALIEGIADYVKIKAGYAEEKYGLKPGDGKRWDQGFEITAYFLDYCASLRPGFVAHLNARLKEGYDVSYFEELLGKPVERLWDDYKNKYGKRN
ncbi:uncharacterized protein LOC141613326 [Silene latifolia]|uniref:uncharacterized protein LOC141613326 n=1 Tax=Silene latifolia TaxID=37657 RepID=UPI003D7731C5